MIFSLSLPPLVPWRPSGGTQAPSFALRSILAPPVSKSAYNRSKLFILAMPFWHSIGTLSYAKMAQIDVLYSSHCANSAHPVNFFCFDELCQNGTEYTIYCQRVSLLRGTNLFPRQSERVFIWLPQVCEAHLFNKSGFFQL